MSPNHNNTIIKFSVMIFVQKYLRCNLKRKQNNNKCLDLSLIYPQLSTSISIDTQFATNTS